MTSFEFIDITLIFYLDYILKDLNDFNILNLYINGTHSITNTAAYANILLAIANANIYVTGYRALANVEMMIEFLYIIF